MYNNGLKNLARICFQSMFFWDIILNVYIRFLAKKQHNIIFNYSRSHFLIVKSDNEHFTNNFTLTILLLWMLRISSWTKQSRLSSLEILFLPR